MRNKKIMAVFGTRPEAIKMAPVVLEINKRQNEGEPVEVIVCVTAQHREMLDQVLQLFDIIPNIDLNIMAPDQDLFDVTNKVLNGVGKVFKENKPDLVLVHGDTTTSFATSLAAYYHHIPVAHVEAGLRTFNIYSPFPEELNRHLTGVIASIHFAPTDIAKNNLIKENVSKMTISVTGNTVIDALFYTVDNLKKSPEKCDMYKKEFRSLKCMDGQSKMVLITGHRRENFGHGFENICSAIAHLADKYKDVDFVYPVHLNPNVREPVYRIIGNKDNVYLLKPLDYEQFVYLMSNAYIILTDSGGIQEEAPSLGKPVIVMRDTTERPEALKSGTVKLSGTNMENIINEVSLLIDDSDEYQMMSCAHNPYGDGLASKRIVDILLTQPFVNKGPFNA